jgi:hypothetical protein
VDAADSPMTTTPFTGGGPSTGRLASGDASGGLASAASGLPARTETAS